MHKSENEKIDFILDEHERISRKQGSLCMALGKGFLVIAILCGVATFCVSGLYLKSLCLSVACCCGVFSRIFNYYSVPEESRMVLSRQELLRLMRLTEDVPDVRQELLKEGANKRGNSSRLTQSFHFFMFEPIFSPVNALNQPI